MLDVYIARVKVPLGDEGVSATMPFILDREIYDSLVKYHDALPPKEGTNIIHMSSEEYERIIGVVQEYVDASNFPDKDARVILQG